MVMGTATMAASSARWCAREGNRGGNGVQGERGEVQGARASPWRREGVGEAATAKQEVAGALRARATPRLCLLAEEDDRGGGSGDGLGRAGPGKWAPGKLGRWPGGLLSLSFISSFLFLFSIVCFDLVLDTKSF